MLCNVVLEVKIKNIKKLAELGTCGFADILNRDFDLEVDKFRHVLYYIIL